MKKEDMRELYAMVTYLAGVEGLIMGCMLKSFVGLSVSFCVLVIAILVKRGYLG